MDGSEEQPVEVPKLVAGLLFALLGLGLLPVLPMVLGYPFLPSIEWASSSSTAGVAAGLIAAAFVLCADLKDSPLIPGREAKQAPGLLLFALIGYFTGRSAAVIFGPMMFTLIAGHPVELTFTVEAADSDGSMRCSRPLELQGLPFFFDRICRVPEDVRQRLTPGGHVVVIGRGTSLGVFAESVRPVD